MLRISGFVAAGLLAVPVSTALAQNSPPEAADDFLSTGPLLTYYGERLIGNAPNVENPDAGRLSDGSAVYVWSDRNSIQGRVAGPSNGPLGNIFAVSSETGGTRNHPVVAELDNGEFLVVWEDSGGADGELGAGIRARRMGREGFPLAPSFRVNADVLGEQTDPEIIRLANGEFVIAWTNWLQDPGGALDYDVRGRRLGTDLAPADADMILNDIDAGDQNGVALTPLQDGGFVASWSDGANGRLRLFNGDLTPRAASVIATSAFRSHPLRLTTLSDGDFIAAWIGSSPSIEARRYAPDGTPRGPVFPADGNSIPYSSAQVSGGAGAFDVTGLPGGGYAFAWHFNQAVFFPPRFFDVRNYIVTSEFTAADQFVRYHDFQGSWVEHVRVAPTSLPSFNFVIGNGASFAFTDAIIARLVEQYTNPLRAAGIHQLFVTANDTDPDSDGISVTHVNGQPIAQSQTLTLPSGASVQLLSQSLQYNTAGFTAARALLEDEPIEDSFTYTISDGLATDTATVTVRLLGLNDSPQPAADAIVFSEDGPARNVAADIIANDIDPDSGETAQLAINSFTAPDNGGTVSGPLPAVTFDPAGAFNSLAAGQTDTTRFSYRLIDPHGAVSASGLVTVTINGANDDPSLAAIAGSTDEVTPVNLTAAILAQVSDPDMSDTHTVTAIDTAGTLGAVTLNAGVLTYDPNGAFDAVGAGQSGTDTFGVTISDPHGGTASALVTMTVNGIGAANQAPVAVNDALSTRSIGLQRGSTSTVSTTASSEAVAMAPVTGGLIAVWTDGDIRGRRLLESGAPSSPEILINMTTAAAQNFPDIAALTGGGAIVVWQDISGTGGDTFGTAIRGQRFNSDMSPAGGEFLVNTTTWRDQNLPSVASLNDGGFVVMWTDDSQMSADASGFAILGQRYNAAGVPQGGEFLVNQVTTNNQTNVSVAGLVGGGFVATWQDQRLGLPASDARVWARRFDSAGNPAGNEFQVMIGGTSSQTEPDVAALADGGFVIVWENASPGIGFRRFTAAGTPVAASPDFNAGNIIAQPVPTLTILTENPVVTGLLDGGFAFAYSERRILGGVPTPSDTQAILVQQYDASGQLVIQRNAGSSGSVPAGQGQNRPAIAPVSAGGYGVAWDRAGVIESESVQPATEAFRANRVEALDVLANDTDPENQPLTITQINGSDLGASEVRALTSGATLQRSANRLNYDPRNAPFAIALPLGVTGTDSFTYTASDGFLADTADVTVTITGVNNGPVANPDQLVFGEDDAVRSVAADVLANDTDPDTGETALLAIYQKTNATNGGIVFGAQGELFYGPNGGFEQLAAGQTAQDSFTYSIIDPQGFFTIIAVPVTVTINGANDAPDAGSISAATGKNSSINVTSFIQQVATDPDNGDTLTITAVGSTGTAGQVSLVNGDVVYDPAGAFPGLGTGQTAQDSFTYTVRDQSGVEATGTATITINGGPNTLAVSLDGLGSGQVGSTPGGIACGNGLSACVSSFAAGSTVTLNASALTGSTFAGWVTGPCAGQTGSCAVPMSSDRNIIARFETDTTLPTPVYLATLPNARGGSVGGPDITAFATAVSGGEAVQGCTISIPAGAPVGFAYQRLDAGNTPFGPLNPEFDIPQNGSVGFVLAMTPNQATGPDGYLMQPQLTCENATADPIEGANSVLLSIAATPGPDILSVSATASGDGIVRIPEIGRTGLMVAAAVNIGAGPTPVTARVDTGAAQLPVTLQVCETDAAGSCLAPRASEVATNIGGAPAFFAVFVRGDGPVALDPANARVFLRFVDAGGVTQSATSAAVTVPAPASAEPVMAGRYSVLVRQANGVWPSLVRASLYVSDDGWAVLDDGVMPRQLPVTGNLEDGVTIGGMGARFRTDGFIRAGDLAMEEAGSFWGVRDARSDSAPDWPDLAGVYAGTAQLTASGGLQGSLAGCQLTGESLASGEAAGLRMIDVQLTGCDASGGYRGVLDVTPGSVPVLIIAGEAEGWSAARQ
jgi:VCBS repeat-containing protein